MNPTAALLLPAIRWDANHGFAAAKPEIDRALALGVGGFILFGGEQERVRALTKELRLKSRVPLLIAADLERGAGQQFSGATGLPPLAAIASLGDADAVRRAARLTAREARTLGLNWDLAPVCDLDIVPENPIVGTRSLGGDSRRVGDARAGVDPGVPGGGRARVREALSGARPHAHGLARGRARGGRIARRARGARSRAVPCGHRGGRRRR